MLHTPKFTLAALLVLVSLITSAGLFATCVQLEPAGVKRYDRERYDQNLAKQRLALELKRKVITENGPIAQVDQVTHDFGRLDPHSQHSHSFEVANVGLTPLTLEVSDTSCKCTVGKLGAGVVEPGQSTTVTLTWNTGYQAEEYEQIAIVRTNDVLHPSIQLSVKGQIRAELIAPESVGMAAANPGEPITGKFTLYSQLFDDFTVIDVRSDLAVLDWGPVVMETDDASLADAEAISALQLQVTIPGRKRGKFSGNLEVEVLPMGGTETIVRTMSLSGRVRAPINFYGPAIHPRTGLETGILPGGKDHHYYLTARARGEGVRHLEVLDVEPSIVQAKLTPTSNPAEFRLRVTIPGDAPTTIFNRDDKHGYVQVGDPKDESFSNWFPINGGIVQID